MRSIELHPQSLELRLSAAQHKELLDWVAAAVEDALAAKSRQDILHTDLLRMYEAVPINPARYANFLEGYKAIEIPLGAIATDSIYAQTLDLIFTISPLLTCRAQDGRYIKHAKAMQRLANFLPDEMNLREAAEHMLFDTCQLGTGCYYVPFTETVLKTSGYKVTERGPKIMAIPPEDIIVFGGSYQNIQNQALFGIRFWYTESEMQGHKKFRKWDISAAKPCPSKDVVRARREIHALSTEEKTNTHVTRYETYELYIQYDIDGDGAAEDLLVNYDRTGRALCRVRYKPYESTPARVARYQIRPHMFYGVGVMEMLKVFQEETTDLHNHQVLNVMLANVRMWAVKRGALATGSIEVFPGRAVPFSDPANDVKELRLSDIYSSLPATQAMVIGLAERRVGINDINLPKPSQVIGSRTPGITTMSMLQQVNKRFTPAFDQMRLATGGAIIEGIMRYSERIQDGDPQVENYFRELLGDEDSALVIEILSKPNFLQRVAVELTASSASVNREADRQNSIMLVNLLGQYYDKALQLVQLASNPQIAAPVRDAAQKIAQAAGEVIERTIRTFDQVRDPQTFIVDISAEIDAAGAQATGEGMLGLVTALAGQGLGGGQPGGGDMGGGEMPPGS